MLGTWWSRIDPDQRVREAQRQRQKRKTKKEKGSLGARGNPTQQKTGLRASSPDDWVTPPRLSGCKSPTQSLRQMLQPASTKDSNHQRPSTIGAAPYGNHPAPVLQTPIAHLPSPHQHQHPAQHKHSTTTTSRPSTTTRHVGFPMAPHPPHHPHQHHIHHWPSGEQPTAGVRLLRPYRPLSAFYILTGTYIPSIASTKVRIPNAAWVDERASPSSASDLEQPRGPSICLTRASSTSRPAGVSICQRIAVHILYCEGLIPRVPLTPQLPLLTSPTPPKRLTSRNPQPPKVWDFSTPAPAGFGVLTPRNLSGLFPTPRSAKKSRRQKQTGSKPGCRISSIGAYTTTHPPLSSMASSAALPSTTYCRSAPCGRHLRIDHWRHPRREEVSPSVAPEGHSWRLKSGRRPTRTPTCTSRGQRHPRTSARVLEWLSVW
ncbi:unnamed protein product [Vitrella brassicaformis CCMP3155]|uniref:Uncharacterized protein n=1 Tax=Vitrella brassicaformis (strain CCMP3155) TaxID=1169540 RepID=A0A0G4EFD5_VITBC|nr:unnamed protein product [Vitrella brassicaformis CCMP3155]|eukprot:CEL94142.1 unnamed protein product [Vitrella brassicaformis CCMP3155]